MSLRPKIGNLSVPDSYFVIRFFEHFRVRSPDALFCFSATQGLVKLHGVGRGYWCDLQDVTNDFFNIFLLHTIILKLFLVPLPHKTTLLSNPARVTERHSEV